MTSSRRPEQLRLFVAVTLPPEVRAALAEVIGRLRDADVPGMRPVAPEALHITLKFLGNVDASRVPDLAAALTAAGDGSVPFRIALQGVGGFPSLEAPRVLWAGVADDAGSLGGLARRVDEACASAGFPREQRPFSPHLTLARMRDTASPSDRRRAGPRWPMREAPSTRRSQSMPSTSSRARSRRPGRGTSPSTSCNCSQRDGGSGCRPDSPAFGPDPRRCLWLPPALPSGFRLQYKPPLAVRSSGH